MKKEEIHWADWHRILFGTAPAEFLLEVVVRTAIIYLVLLVVLRVMGKRMGGQLTISELAVMLTLGAIIAVPMQAPDQTVKNKKMLMRPLTIWAANTQAEIPYLEPETSLQSGKLELTVYLTSDSLWLMHTWNDGSRIGFRAVFSPSGELKITDQREADTGLRFDLECSTMKHTLFVGFPDPEALAFRYTVQAEPKMPLLVPCWPKDILAFEKNGKVKQEGEIHTQQTGTRSGTLFFNDGESGSVFYFQNLSALNGYCQATQTSAGGVVGGSWPEIGFSLPAASNPLEAGQLLTLTDAFVRLEPKVLKQASAISIAFLNHLAETYLVIPRPERHYHNWLDTVERGLDDLYYHKGCWAFAEG